MCSRKRIISFYLFISFRLHHIFLFKLTTSRVEFVGVMWSLEEAFGPTLIYAVTSILCFCMTCVLGIIFHIQFICTSIVKTIKLITNNLIIKLSLITSIMQHCFLFKISLLCLSLSLKPSHSKQLIKMGRLSIIKESIKSSKNSLSKVITDQNPSFYESSRYIFITAQAFAVMPLSGLCQKGKKDKLDQLTFRWGSLNTIYSVCCILSVGSMCLIAAKSTFKEGVLKIGKICKTVLSL